MDKEKLILKYLDGEISEKELQELKATGDIDFLEKVDQHLSAFKAPEFDITSSYQEITASRKIKKSRSISIAPIFYRVAAVLVMGLFIGLYFFSSNSGEDTITISFDNQAEVYLPDSSFIQLNKGSSITYNEVDFISSRIVELEGEAVFSITKGHDFVVNSKNGQITVLGTVFNVMDRPGIFEVTCYEGKVKVLRQSEEKILTANRKLRSFDDEIVFISTISDNESPSWLNGKSEFESVPYRLVIQEFERQYDVSVKLKNFNQKQLFTGSFVHDDLKLALKSITIPFNLSFKLAGNEVILSSDRK